LDSHPAIRQRGEVIGEWRMRQPEIKAKIIECGPVEYVECQFKRKSRSEAAVGIKMNYYQLGEKYARKWGVDRIPEVYDFLKLNEDIKIIHLKRRNRLKTLASARVAAKTNRYVVTDKSELANDRQIELSADECISWFKRIGALEEQYDEAFRSHNLYEAIYEEIVLNKDRECDRILQFLGVATRPLQSKTLKLNKRPLSEIIKNYWDLKEHFADTEWGKYFDD
jgi:hypothetical protein